MISRRDAIRASASAAAGVVVSGVRLSNPPANGSARDSKIRFAVIGLNHVHVKDVREGVLARLRAEDGSFLKGVLEGVFTVPGDGTIDFRAFMRVVKEIGYAGWVVVEAEQDPAKANPSAMARIGHDELKAACRDAGIVIAA